ncbi:MAG: molybdopterin-dependent oxidoreductase [Chloroflexi bacterium]|nr:molybdopterin-dependent oxidoreductase [Chloroflexota bacterium]
MKGHPSVHGSVEPARSRYITERLHVYCPMCKARCGAVAVVENGVFARVEPDREHPNGGALCAKAAAAPELVYSPQRLKHPMRRTRPKGDPDPGWVPVEWDEALDTVAKKLLEIRSTWGAEAVVFNRSGPGGSASIDFEPWLARLSRAFGTPNFSGTTHVCNWHKDVASRYTYGTGIPSPDFEHTSSILLWGHTPQNTWLTQERSMSKARARGARLVVVDPRRTEAAKNSDVWLAVRPGTDGALALGMLNVLLLEGLFDEEFVRNWTNGPLLVRRDNGRLLRESDLLRGGDPNRFSLWDTAEGRPVAHDHAAPPVAALVGSHEVTLASGARVEVSPAFQLLLELVEKFSPGRVEEITWVPEEKIRSAVRMLAENRPVCYYVYTGVGQHTNATQTDRAIATFYSLLGDFDSPGGNVIFPTIRLNPIDGKEFLAPEAAERRLGHGEYPLGPPSTAGQCMPTQVCNAILTGQPYPVKAMVAFGGNFVMAVGDTPRVHEALKAIEFLVYIDLFLTPTAELADMVLPAASCWETWGVRPTFEQGADTSRYAQYRPSVVGPRHESRPDTQIIFELASRLGLGEHFWGGDVETAANYHLAPSGLSLEALRANPGGISVPLETRYRKYADRKQGGAPVGFATPTRLVEVYSENFHLHGQNPLPRYVEPGISPVSRPDLAIRYPLILTNAKLSHYCHGQHRALPSLRRQVPHPFVEIHPETAKARGVVDGDWVVIETPYGSITVVAWVTDDIDPRVVCTQHGWWQSCPELEYGGYNPYGPDGANVNLLVSAEVADPISGSLPFRSNMCEVRKE